MGARNESSCEEKMSKEEETTRKWLDDLVPRIAKSLQKNVDGVRYELSVPDDTFYLSSMYYLTIKMPEDEGENLPSRELKVIVKRPPQLEIARNVLNTDCQFHNEIVFYRQFAKGSDAYPMCIYTDERPPADSVVALENVTERGFSVYTRKYNVPLEYAIACMRELGRFHGAGYAMKETNNREFKELVRNIRETRFERNGNNSFEEFINAVSPRAVRYLRANGYDTLFCDKMEAFLDNTYENVMLKASESTEPLSTLCHGDLTLNNILFGKDDDSKPKAMFIDFALMRYGPPVIDLSTLLYLCCSHETIKEHFDEMFRAYHDSLMCYLTNACVPNLERFSYEAFLKNYKEHALFGFVITSFFLVILMGKCTVTPETLTTMCPEETIKMNLESGGDEVSQILADMLLELKDSGCLKHVL